MGSPAKSIAEAAYPGGTGTTTSATMQGKTPMNAEEKEKEHLHIFVNRRKFEEGDGVRPGSPLLLSGSGYSGVPGGQIAELIENGRAVVIYRNVPTMGARFGLPAATLQANLRKFREMRGMTQSEMGARADIAAASISHFETGQRTPSLETLVKLADSLNVTVDALLGRAPVESAARIDPVFLRASRADADTLETVRRVTAAILADAKVSR